MAGLCTGPGPCDAKSFGSGDNWVNRRGGLPPYVRAVAHAFQRGGMTESAAIARAIGVIRNWAQGKGNVTAATRARAAAALAQWEAMKGSKNLTAETAAAIDLASSGGHHVPGTPFNWRHGYHPLNAETALENKKSRKLAGSLPSRKDHHASQGYHTSSPAPSRTKGRSLAERARTEQLRRSARGIGKSSLSAPHESPVPAGHNRFSAGVFDMPVGPRDLGKTERRHIVTDASTGQVARKLDGSLAYHPTPKAAREHAAQLNALHTRGAYPSQRALSDRAAARMDAADQRRRMASFDSSTRATRHREELRAKAHDRVAERRNIAEHGAPTSNLDALHVTKADKGSGYNVTHKASGKHAVQGLTKTDAEATRQELAKHGDWTQTADKIVKDPAILAAIRQDSADRNDRENLKAQAARAARDLKTHGVTRTAPANPAKVGDLVMLSRTHVDQYIGSGSPGRTETTNHTVGRVSHVTKEGHVLGVAIPAHKTAMGQDVGPSHEFRQPNDKLLVADASKINVDKALADVGGRHYRTDQSTITDRLKAHAIGTPKAEPHPAPHTVKPGEHATISGSDHYGNRITLTGKVNTNDAQGVFRHGSTEGKPVRVIGISRQGSSGMTRTDHVIVPDPTRSTVTRQTNAQALADARKATEAAKPRESFDESVRKVLAGNGGTLGATADGLAKMGLGKSAEATRVRAIEKASTSALEGKDARSMTAAQKVEAFRRMHGRDPSPEQLRKLLGIKAEPRDSRTRASLAAAPSATADLAVPFDESKHPRVGGKFAPKGTQTQGAQPKPPTTGQINPALAAQIRDFQKRMGLPVTGNFDQATVAKIQAVRTAKGGGGGGGGGKGKGGGKGGASKGGAAAKKQQAAAKAYLKAQQTAAKKAAAQQKAAAAKAAKPQSAATKLRTAASKSPALQAYLKASAAAHNGQVAAGKARTAQKAAATASNVKATAAVAAKLAHH